MNRCLTEGRQALSGRLAGIEGGVECARLAPLLSALADGEADAAALARLRPHLKTCLSCRARLREFRAAPRRVAAVVPIALTAGEEGLRRVVEGAIGALQQKAEALLAATHHKAAALSERTQTAAELVTGQKVAALAASAAALAGGGTAVDHLANHDGLPRPAATARQAQAEPPTQPRPTAPPPASPPSLTTEQPAITEQAPSPEPEGPAAPPPDPANEFEAGAASANREPAAAAAAVAPAVERLGADPAPTASARPARRSSDVSGEFAP